MSSSMTPQTQAECPQLDSGLAVPMFQQGEDPIECINKAMSFLFVVASRFPPSNNQLRTSSNPRNQATIQYGRVTIQQVQERHHQSYAGIGNKRIATTSKGNVAVGLTREKLMLAEAQEAGQILDEEQLAFLADPDCDDLSSAKEILMDNLSSYDLEVISEVPYSESYPNDMINQDVQEMQYSEQTHVDDFEDDEIHSSSNIISYSQYLQETQDAVIHDTNPSAPNDLWIQPTLYDGSGIAKEHDVISVIDDEETLILEEESRSKMLDKQNDPILVEKKIKISPIDYSKLNKIKEDFGKHFVTQKELSAKQAFWLKHSTLSETPVTLHTHVRIEAPSELPKIFQRENSGENLNAPTFNQLFEINELKAQSQAKDTVIRKLKERIKSLSEKDSVEKVKKDIVDIETINIELEHKHCDSLIAQINSKSLKNSELNAQLQEKVFAITTLKNELRKIKGKNVVNTVVSKPNATLAPGLFKLDK
ncbi:hypothetical protein Tco_0715052 [Tanacetum coccineum]